MTTETIIKDGEVKVYYANKEFTLHELSDHIQDLTKVLNVADAAAQTINQQ